MKSILHLLTAAVLAGAALTTVSCKSAKKDGAMTDADTVALAGPAFSADSAYAYAARQCDFGPRTMNSDAHDRCGEWIAGKFRYIFASSFIYDENGEAAWPGIAVDSTNKTQFIFKINKGIFSARDSVRLNSSMAEEKKRIPFPNMIYFGDGETDVPCMKIVGMFGGHSLAVYKQGDDKKRAIAQKLKRQGRVRFAVPAVYTKDSEAFRVVCAIIDKIKAESELQDLA